MERRPRVLPLERVLRFGIELVSKVPNTQTPTYVLSDEDGKKLVRAASVACCFVWAYARLSETGPKTALVDLHKELTDLLHDELVHGDQL